MAKQTSRRSPSEDPDRPGRTPIWSEGRQNPPFEPRAFARASLIFGREALAGLFSRCARSAGTAGDEVASGRWRVPEARLGRTGRYLPHHQTVAATIRGAGGILSRSSRLLGPAEDPAPPATIFAPPGPARRPAPVLTVISAAPEAAPRDPADSAAPETSRDSSLAAIRLIMGGKPEMPATPSAAPRRAPARRIRPAAPPPVHDLLGLGEGAELPAEPPAAAPVAPPRHGSLRRLMAEATARALAYGILVMALPWGALRAGIAHLDGVDLRKLDR